MFHKLGNKGVIKQAKPLKDLMRTLTPEVFLAEEKRALLVQQIRDASVLEEARFDSLCMTLMTNLIHYCQNLPEASNSYYSQAGGLLEYALNRTEAALNLFRQFLIADEKGEFSEEQGLWQYALFSAAMLQGIGKLQIDYQVDIYDKNGHFIKLWNPLLETIPMVGAYYGHSLQKESDLEFRRRLNILLAKLLMPSGGFAWLASDPQVLAVWLALLNEDPYAAGTLGAVLIRADAVAIQRYFNQHYLRQHAGRAALMTLPGTFSGGVPGAVGLEKQIGVEFLQWLTKMFESGHLMLNKVPLILVPGGVLLSSEVFKLFIRDNPEYKNWQAVKNGFLSLGMHAKGVDGNVVSRFEQSDNHQMHSGVVFTGYPVALPPEVQVHNLSTGRSIPMSAIEVIHMSQFNNYFTRQHQAVAETALQGLNTAGKWQPLLPPSAPTPNSRMSGVPSGA